MASFYAFDPDQKFCRGDKCIDPVKPIPGLQQQVAKAVPNQLYEPPKVVVSGHVTDPAKLQPQPIIVSSSAPSTFLREPKPANVIMAGVVFALVVGLTSDDLKPADLLVKSLLFMLAWHSLRYAFPVYY